MDKRAFVVFLFLYPYLLIGQSNWTEIFKIEGSSDFIATDVLENIYRVDQTELYKYDSQGKFQFRYSDKQLGVISSIDVTYPLRPLVLYADLNYVILLDNTLSNNRGNINLVKHEIGLAQAACSSVQNHFWFYDAMQFALIRTNENFNQVSTSGNLSQILGIDLNPNFMVEFANRVYLNNPETGILVFDIFGTYIKTIPLKGLEQFQVFEDEIVYFENQRLYQYNTKLFQAREIEINPNAENAYFWKDRIILDCPKEVIVLKKTL